MKLSIWSSYYIDLSPEDAILELEKHGYRYTELSDEHSATLLSRGDAKTVGAEFKRFAEAHNVSILQGHLALRIALCSKEQNSIEILKTWLDLFEAIGIKYAVLHCDSFRGIPDLDASEIKARNKEALAQLVNYLEGKDLTICLENLCSRHKTAEELLYYIDELGSEHLGICLDTGHLNLSKAMSQEAFIKAAGNHLKALHIADNEGERDQHIFPFGVGNIDIISAFKALKEIGYDGLFNLEVGGERKCPLEIRGFKLNYVRQCMQYLERIISL